MEFSALLWVICYSIWSWRKETLQLFPKSVSWAPGTREGWARPPESILDFAKQKKFSHLNLSTIPCEEDHGSTVVQMRKWRHRLGMWLICLEPDRAKMTLEIIYANFSLTCLPPNTSFLPGYLLLCQITWQHTASLILYKYHFFPIDSFRLAYVFN